MEIDWKSLGASLWDDKNVLQWDCSDVYTTLNAVKNTELYIMNEWRVWYVNHISIKLLKSHLGENSWYFGSNIAYA